MVPRKEVLNKLSIETGKVCLNVFVCRVCSSDLEKEVSNPLLNHTWQLGIMKNVILHFFKYVKKCNKNKNCLI